MRHTCRFVFFPPTPGASDASNTRSDTQCRETRPVGLGPRGIILRKWGSLTQLVLLFDIFFSIALVFPTLTASIISLQTPGPPGSRKTKQKTLLPPRKRKRFFSHSPESGVFPSSTEFDHLAERFTKNCTSTARLPKEQLLFSVCIIRGKHPT